MPQKPLRIILLAAALACQAAAAGCQTAVSTVESVATQTTAATLPYTEPTTESTTEPPTEPTTESTAATTTTKAPPTAPPAPRVYTIQSGNREKAGATLLLMGDIMCTAGQQRYAKRDDGSYDFSPSFKYIKPVLARGDFAAGTLETIVTEDAPYKTEQTNVWNGEKLVPYCNAPPAFLSAVKDAGIRAVFTSNNHCLDDGVAGLESTIGNLDRYGLLHTGTFRSGGGQRYLLADVNGIKIAFVAYATYMNKMQDALRISRDAVDRHINYYANGGAGLKAAIKSAKANGAEYVVVSMHWGKIGSAGPDDSQVQAARAIAAAGADYIVGSHPHVLHRYGAVTAPDGRRVPVAYSLGNFVTAMDDAADDINRDSAILQIELSRDETGKLTAKDGYIPVFTELRYGGERCVVLPCDGSVALPSLEQAKARIRRALGEGIAEVG